jgi:Uma2 family endonuclease
MTALPKQTYTPEEYLALERKADYRSEYINGEIYAMAGASREHNLIALNLASEIRAQLRQKPCETYVADMRVRVEATNLYTYPDIVVVCGEPAFAEDKFDTLTNPTVLIEILSYSTASYDRVSKFHHFRRLPSLQEYILVHQEKAAIEHYVLEENKWTLVDIFGLDSKLSLSSINCEIGLQDIYERVEFPQDLPEENPAAGIYKI